MAALVLSDSIPLMTNSALSVGKKRKKGCIYLFWSCHTWGGRGMKIDYAIIYSSCAMNQGSSKWRSAFRGKGCKGWNLASHDAFHLPSLPRGAGTNKTHKPSGLPEFNYLSPWAGIDKFHSGAPAAPAIAECRNLPSLPEYNDRPGALRQANERKWRSFLRHASIVYTGPSGS